MFGFFGMRPAFAGRCGHHHHHKHHKHGWGHSEMHGHHRGGGGGFGVRRPLRFMARKLDLNEEQIAQLAIILDDLKTERAQARVDHRRAVAAFADAFLSESFDRDAVSKATEARAASAARVQEAVLSALERTHAILTPEQRKQLALLLRSGGLEI